MNPKTLLDQHELQPKKALGQNFLHDPQALEKIVNSATLSPDEIIVEVGPGTGTLTTQLAQTGNRVIAVEVDQRLRPILNQQLDPYPNAEVVYEDILNVDVAALVDHQPYVVVANVPYYITSAILRHFLESRHKPRRMIITMQLEVAERLISQPGDMSVLSVSVQFYGKPSIIAKLKPGVFWPRPEVDSAVISVDVYETPPVDIPDEKRFFRVVRAGFGQKRKQLRNSLSGGLAIKGAEADELLAQAEIDPRRRAETLSLEEWARLSHAHASKWP